MSIAAATMITSVGFPRASTSFNNFGRKKARKASRCLSPLTTSTKITDQQNNSILFKRSGSFNSNVALLCDQFPSVHCGIISSLLESASNDVSKASCLIQQISESVTNSHSSQNPSTRRAKRHRDWAAVDVSMEDDQSDDEPTIPSQTAKINESNISHPIPNVPQIDSPFPKQQTSSNSFPHPPPSSTSVSQSSPSDSPLSPIQSSDDAPMNQQRPSSPSSTIASLAPPHTSSPPSLSVNGSFSKSLQTVQGLKHTIQVLSRVILKQNDRMTLLQTEQNRLLDENRQLKSSLDSANDELKQCRETNQVLQFYVSSSNRVSTSDFLGTGENGGSGPSGCNGGGLDFFKGNRMPDVF